ncbi:uncharacterized protein LOC142336625 [Convolutriloba macropyga]|uniref:uncharacterized protein LOC142336625 n=1 Tax=Convolutriloba macropyga TaxID=536237 RepID=UPI003F524C36
MERFVHGIILTELRTKRGQEKFPLSYSPVHVFLVFTVALHLTNCSSFQIEWSRHYHECPCLRNVDMAMKTFDAKTLDSCFTGCMATDGCHAFSYCDISFECKVYNHVAVSFTYGSIVNQSCSQYPSESVTSNRKWYWRHEVKDGPTTSCQTIKDAEPTSQDGYYEVQVRGVKMNVYCVMGPGETYIDLDAYSNHGGNGNGNDSPVSEARKTFSKGRLLYDNCLLNLGVDSFRFATHSGDEVYPIIPQFNGKKLLLELIEHRVYICSG